MSYTFRRDNIHYYMENGHVQMIQLKQLWGLKINAMFFSPCGVWVWGRLQQIGKALDTR